MAEQNYESLWGPPTNEPKIGIEDLEAWRQARAQVAAYAVARQPQMSKAEVARRCAVSNSTFSEWFSGTYRGAFAAVTEKVFNALRAEEERASARAMMISEPPFLILPTAKRVQDALILAQTAPTMALITLGPGMGKTETARNFCATRPNAFRVVMRPSTQSVHMMLREIASTFGISSAHPSFLSRFIGDKLKRNGRHTLLIVDEAQHLTEQAVNELRYLLDEFGCGIALLGNEDVHARFGGAAPREGYGQLHRRIGIRVRQLQPTPRDIDEFVAAWDVADADAVNLLRAIGRKPGALGQIKGTIQLAGIAAMARGAEITADDVRQAWVNRSGEEIR